MHFSNIVTTEIAKEAIDFLTRMYHLFDSNVAVVQDPREATCYEIAKFLQENPNMPYDFQDGIILPQIITHWSKHTWEKVLDNNNSKYSDIADRSSRVSRRWNDISCKYESTTLIFRVPVKARITAVIMFYKTMYLLYMPFFHFNHFCFQINYSSRIVIQKNRRFGDKNETDQKMQCIMHTGQSRGFLLSQDNGSCE